MPRALSGKEVDPRALSDSRPRVLGGSGDSGFEKRVGLVLLEKKVGLVLLSSPFFRFVWRRCRCRFCLLACCMPLLRLLLLLLRIAPYSSLDQFAALALCDKLLPRQRRELGNSGANVPVVPHAVLKKRSGQGMIEGRLHIWSDQQRDHLLENVVHR